MTHEDRINKLILHPSFNETVEEVNLINVHLPSVTTSYQMEFDSYVFPTNGELVTAVEETGKVSLNAKSSEGLKSINRPILAYDESINKFSCLEGVAFYASHSLVLAGPDDFVPMNLLTFHFYTRSKGISEKTHFIKHSSDPEVESKKDFVRDKVKFLVDSVPEKSLLLIDGPLIGGDVSSYWMKGVRELYKKDVIPIFFVKNSSSNLVTNNTPELRHKYNSDLHWAFRYLAPRERTGFFRYQDKRNPDNAKVFSYLKAHDLSPQRVEFHVDTYKKHRDLIHSIMDLILYLILVQGDLRNPQARPIAIAEKYARATLKLLDFDDLMRKSGVVPTMNQERFAW